MFVSTALLITYMPQQLTHWGVGICQTLTAGGVCSKGCLGCRQPSIVEIQILRVGQFVILCVPGELTTMAGRRLREAVQAQVWVDLGARQPWGHISCMCTFSVFVCLSVCLSGRLSPCVHNAGWPRMEQDAEKLFQETNRQVVGQVK